jgi:hypothetical protein
MANINLNINEGRKGITINGDENRKIYINLSDSNILVRAKKAKQLINEKVKDIENIPTPQDDTNKETYLDKIDEINQFYRNQINYIFNYNVSDVVFGDFEPTTLCDNGESLAEVFLDQILPEVASSVTSAQKKSEKRIKTYTAKYDKE